MTNILTTVRLSLCAVFLFLCNQIFAQTASPWSHRIGLKGGSGYNGLMVNAEADYYLSYKLKEGISVYAEAGGFNRLWVKNRTTKGNSFPGLTGGVGVEYDFAKSNRVFLRGGMYTFLLDTTVPYFGVGYSKIIFDIFEIRVGFDLEKTADIEAPRVFGFRREDGPRKTCKSFTLAVVKKFAFRL